MARLELRWRNSTTHASQDTGRRDFLDFVVDGRSLHELLNAREGVTILGGWFPNAFFEAIYLRGLLLEHPGYLETGRYELYVCPICGDTGCGSTTMAIEAGTNRVIWKDFGMETDYENNWDDHEVYTLFTLRGYEHVGPFEFERQQYGEALLTWPLRPVDQSDGSSVTRGASP